MVWIGLEGCDGTGKTTLAEAVRAEVEERFGSATLIHKGPPERSVLEEYATDVEGREGENLVFDRWHLGTLVYAALYRGTGPYGELGLAGFRWVEKFLQARGARFYVVDKDYDAVAARLAARGEDYLQSHHVKHVLRRFREVHSESILTGYETFVVPEGIHKVPLAAKILVDNAVHHATGVEVLRRFPSYVGGLYPDLLLIGEKRGGQPPFESEACFMPLKNKSGEYLWDALTPKVYDQCGVANACEDDIGELWETLHFPPVVALGRAASGELAKLKIKHAGVPHPQYVKRFANNRRDEYGALIEKAATTGEQYFSWPN